MQTTAIAEGSDAKIEEVAVRPFVKWAGGKTQLLDEIVARVPEKYGCYFEPMIGGGLFFSTPAGASSYRGPQFRSGDNLSGGA